MVNRPDLMSIPFHWTSQATEKTPFDYISRTILLLPLELRRGGKKRGRKILIYSIKVCLILEMLILHKDFSIKPLVKG